MSTIQGILYIPIVIILHHFYGLTGLIWSMTLTEGIDFVACLIMLIPYLLKLNNGKLMENQPELAVAE